MAAALAWGAADFCGRFTSRRLGTASAVLGIMALGAILLFPAARNIDLSQGPLWALAVASFATLLAPLALYRALTLAPMSLVLPLGAAYPALLVPVAVLLGARPSAPEWAGMAATVAGVLVVARTAPEDPDDRISADPANRRRALPLALLASLLFAVALGVGEAAVAAYGAVPTLWVGRTSGTLLLLAAFAARRQRPQLPLAWLPLLLLQGGLDAGAFTCFYLGAELDAPVATVTSAAFMVVGVLLGWALLKERLTAACWAGVALVFGGVAVLSWLR